MTIRFLSGAAIRASFRYYRSWPGTRWVRARLQFRSKTRFPLNGKRSALLAPHRANWLSFIHDNFALYFKTQNDNDVWSTVLCWHRHWQLCYVIVSSLEVWLFGSLTILSPKWRNWTTVLVCITALCYKKNNVNDVAHTLQSKGEKCLLKYSLKSLPSR